MTSKGKDKNLPDIRYDEKLFKQAYKAAKEGREISKRQKKRKQIFKIIYITLIPLVLGLSVFLYFKFKPEHIEYIVTNSPNVKENLYTWTEPNIDPPSKIKGLDVLTQSQSNIVVNANTGEILSSLIPEEKLPIASITKLMSVLVILDTYNMDQSIEVSRANIPEDLDWQLELKKGDTILVSEILEAMLISSYNDSAFVIANAYPETGYTGFINAMNEKARTLGMLNSSFNNPAGLDNEENFSTALDVSKLVTAVLNSSQIMEIVNKKSAIVTWRSQKEIVSKEIYSTNPLLSENIYNKGLKTGSTKEAGKCFAGYFQYPNGDRVITVVLNSTDRFTDTNKLEKTFRR